MVAVLLGESGMVVVLGILALVIGLGSLACWIMEIVAAFNRGDGPLMGILSIVLCGLGGFIIGWINHAEWGITNLMYIWTGLAVASFALQFFLSIGGG
jgi:hypothetical protein